MGSYTTTRILWVSCCVLALLFGSVHARRSPYQEVFDDLPGFSLRDITSGQYLSSLMAKKGEGAGDEPAFVATRYFVPPSIRKEFEDAWDKYEAGASKEEGNEVVDLKKPFADNTLYISYSEWTTLDEFVEHLEAGYAKDFKDFISEKGINLELIPLKKLADNQDSKRPSLKKGEGKMAHLLMQFRVPPGKADEFKSQWRQTADMTWEEDRNRIYALHKVATNNNEYWVYGTWDDAEALQEHMLSVHVAQLRKFADEKNVIWNAFPLKKIGHEPE